MAGSYFRETELEVVEAFNEVGEMKRAAEKGESKTGESVPKKRASKNAKERAEAIEDKVIICVFVLDFISIIAEAWNYCTMKYL